MKKRNRFIIAIISLSVILSLFSCSDSKEKKIYVTEYIPQDCSEGPGQNPGQNSDVPDIVCGNGQGENCGVLAINVFDEDYKPVPLAKVYANNTLIGHTGNVEFGTIGYLKKFLKEGEYTIYSENLEKTHGGKTIVTVSQLNTANAEIFIETLSCDNIDCGEHGSCNESTFKCDCSDDFTGENCEIPPLTIYVCKATNYKNPMCIDLIERDGWDKDTADAYCSGMDDTGAEPETIQSGIEEACSSTLDPDILVKRCEATKDMKGNKVPLAYIYAVEKFPDEICSSFLGGTLIRPPYPEY